MADEVEPVAPVGPVGPVTVGLQPAEVSAGLEVLEAMSLAADW